MKDVDFIFLNTRNHKIHVPIEVPALIQRLTTEISQAV